MNESKRKERINQILRELAHLYRKPPEKGGFIIWCKKMAIQYDRLAMEFLNGDIS